MVLVHCTIATDRLLGSHQEQTREHDGQGCPHESTAAGARDAHPAASTRAHQTSLSSGGMSTPGPLHVITQALFSAACAYGHNAHRDRCDL
jgi:hypothetical protein